MGTKIDLSVNDVITIERILNRLKIPNEIYTYKGVGHAFANPSGDNYAPKENADAWQKPFEFFDKYTF